MGDYFMGGDTNVGATLAVAPNMAFTLKKMGVRGSSAEALRVANKPRSYFVMRVPEFGKGPYGLTNVPQTTGAFLSSPGSRTEGRI